MLRIMLDLNKIVVVFWLLIAPFLSFAEREVFINNEGQLIDVNGKQLNEVFCFFKGKDFEVYFQKNKISYVLKKANFSDGKSGTLNKLKPNFSVQNYRVDLEFIDCNNPTISFNKPLNINQRYLNQSVGELYIKDGHQEILYKNIYEGIDLRFYFKNEQLKYDFIVHQNGDYKDIKMKYVGAESIISESSKIIVQTPIGNLEEIIPEIYQHTTSTKKIVKGKYVLSNNEVSFEIENFNSRQKLIIDPWATFIGGVDIEEAYSTFIDNEKNTYVSGYTGSVNFPVTVGVLQTVKQGLYDAFLTKLDTTGNVIWSTLYGGVGDEYGYEVLVDTDDNPYLIGYTNGNDLFVSSSGVFQSVSNGSYDSFILKLDSAGNFIWATYFGGSGGEFTLSADIDNNNNIIIGGFTSSIDMPTINSFQGTMGGALDAFVAKFNTSGNLTWSTYCGGSNSEDVHVLKTDAQNNIIISGETYSSDFPTSAGAFQSINNGNLDVFLAKYDALGNRIFSTYFGGTVAEDANGITTDILNNIYLVGYSASNDFPLIGSSVYQNIKDLGKDAFIVKFSPLGQPLASTFIGGDGDDFFTSAEISSTGSLYVAGYTNSTNMPIVGTPYQNVNNGLSDGVYYKLDTALMPNYSTYIGGISADFITDLYVDSNQLLTFVGYSSSSDFPTTSGVFQEILSGQSDAFVFQSDSIFNISTGLSNYFTSTNLVSTYPNPFNDAFNLTINDFSSLDTYQVFIYSANGKVVLDKRVYKKSSSFDTFFKLKSGNYLIVLLKNETVIYSNQLIKK